MKLKMNYVTFSIVIFITLFVLRSAWFLAALPNVELMAEKGQIDIEDQYFTDNEYMYIEGEWLVEAGQIQQFVQSDEEIAFNHELISLSMVVTVDQHNQSPVSIQIPSSEYKMHTFIDNQLLSSTYDRQGTTYQTHRVSFYPELKTFTLRIDIEGNGNGIELPFSDRYIAIGSAEAIELRNNLGNIFAVSVIAILVLVLLSCIVFYIFINRNRLVRYIIFLLLFPTIGELYTLALPYINWIKQSYNFESKFYMVLFFLSHFTLIFLFKHLLGKYKIPNMNLIILLYSLTLVGILLMPVSYVVVVSLYLIVFYITWIVYCSLHLFRYIIISRYEMYSLLYIGLSVLSGLLWGAIKSNINYNIPFYPYDYFGMMLGFAGFWYNRYIQNLKEIKISEQKKEQFLQSVSEQLSIPLNKLDLELDEYFKADLRAEEQKKIVMLKSTVSGMSFVLNNWLDYFRIKDKTLKVHRQPIDVVATLNSICDMVKENLEVTDIHIHTQASQQIPYTMTDSRLLNQVLYNLIYLQLEKQNHGAIYLDCTYVLQEILIKIEDGTKVGEERYIWSTETDLPIAVQICEAIIYELGGSLELKENGYLIWLPCEQDHIDIPVEAEQERLNDEMDAIEATKDSCRILVYGVEINTFSTVQSVTKSLGYSLIQATSMTEFKSYYDSQLWDLIILESALKDSSSLDVLHMIRSRFSLIDLPVLIVIVPTSTTFITTYFQKGMNDYVIRPIHAIELKHKIKTLLQTKAIFDQRLQLEASLLQNQVEPHFLFNTLNSIASLSKIDMDRMVMLLEQFGHYLSSGFNKRLLKTLIDLQDEIDIVKSYLYIEELRYEPYLKVEWDIEEIFDVEIPPYSVQTIVENAIKHGIRKKRYGGTIMLSVKKYNSFVQIKVSDDGVGMGKEKLESLFTNDLDNGIGFYNTHVRLKRSFGEGLHIESEEGKGTVVSFKIPQTKTLKNVDS